MDRVHLSPEIPQDIIDNIIGELTGDSDSDTLKCCATVSRSFLHPSRRSLFAAIRFHTQEQTERLHDLLTTVPEISLYIHELSFAIHKPEGVHDPQAWLRTDKTLATFLRMLPGLRVLSWEMTDSLRLRWDDDFSNELQSALMDLFRSPSLTDVTISNIDCLPLSIFNAFTHIRRLILQCVKLKGTSALPPFQLAELEALMISVQINPEDAEFFTPTSSSFPNLSCLSIDSGPGGVSLFNQRIIQSSARSIERLIYDLWWQAPNVDLGIIENLHVIIFTVTGRRPGWKSVLRSLLEYFKNPSVTKSLKELNIGFLIQQQEFTTLPNFEGWKDLDAILFPLPTLQKILILVYFMAEDISTSQLQSAMQGQFPLLEGRGILSITGNFDDLGVECQ